MEDQAQSVLIVAGTKYHLNKVLMGIKSMPKQEINVEELTPFDQVQVAEVEPADPKLNHSRVVLFKREGKWIIIAGRETARRAVEEGKGTVGITLLSSQALKRAKVEPFIHPATPSAPRPEESREPSTRYPRDFSNSPFRDQLGGFKAGHRDDSYKKPAGLPPKPARPGFIGRDEATRRPSGGGSLYGKNSRTPSSR